MSPTTPAQLSPSPCASGSDGPGGLSEQPIFAARTRRRARAVTAAGTVLAVLVVLWLLALIGGGAGFASLPAWRTPVAAAPAPPRAMARATAPNRAHLIRAAAKLRQVRHRGRHALQA
jgi:hypothetical protein